MRRPVLLHLLAIATTLALAGCGARDANAPATATRADAPAPAVDVTADLSAADTTAPMPPEDPAAAHFRRLDADRNGRVTPDEHVQGAAAMFRAMDGDDDGRVTAAEMDAAQAAMGGDARLASADKIRVIDTNRDGELGAKEHEGGSRTMFATLDTSADGVLDLAEVRAGHDRLLGGGKAGE